MRGVVSLAAALAVPLSCANGQCFPYRDLLIFLTVIVIASTLILQGVTLPAVVRKFGFAPDQSHEEDDERRARLFLSREGVRRMDELARANNIDLDDPAFQKLLNKYLDRAVAQRTVLIAMREKHEVDEGVFRRLQKELDLEESHLFGRH